MFHRAIDVVIYGYEIDLVNIEYYFDLLKRFGITNDICNNFINDIKDELKDMDEYIEWYEDKEICINFMEMLYSRLNDKTDTILIDGRNYKKFYIGYILFDVDYNKQYECDELINILKSLKRSKIYITNKKYKPKIYISGHLFSYE